MREPLKAGAKKTGGRRLQIIDFELVCARLTYFAESTYCTRS